MKPIPISRFVPPVTGHGTFAGAVYANRHDPSGTFRQRPRSVSVKRMRLEPESDADAAYNLTQSYPRPTLPERPGLDLAGIEGLLIEAGPKVETVRKLLEDDAEATKKAKLPPCTKSVGELCILLFSILEAVCEKGVKPLATNPIPIPKERPPRQAEPEDVKARRELKKTLETAEKSAVIFNLNLGSVPIMNKDTLNNNFSRAVLDATNQTALTKKISADESRTIVDDMLSCVKELTFLGQSTKPYANDKNPEDPMLNQGIHTIPVKVDFDSKTERINFERTFKEKTGLKVAQSIPKKIKKIYDEYNTQVRQLNKGKWVIIRIDPSKLCLRALVKEAGEKKWSEFGTHSLVDGPEIIVDEEEMDEEAPKATGSYSYCQ